MGSAIERPHAKSGPSNSGKTSETNTSSKNLLQQMRSRILHSTKTWEETPAVRSFRQLLTALVIVVCFGGVALWVVFTLHLQPILLNFHRIEHVSELSVQLNEAYYEVMSFALATNAGLPQPEELHWREASVMLSQISDEIIQSLKERKCLEYFAHTPFLHTIITFADYGTERSSINITLYNSINYGAEGLRDLSAHIDQEPESAWSETTNNSAALFYVLNNFHTRVSPDLLPLVDLVNDATATSASTFLAAEMITLLVLLLGFIAVGLAWFPIMRRVQKETSALLLLQDLPQQILQEMADSFVATDRFNSQALGTENFERQRQRQRRKRILSVSALFALLSYFCITWSGLIVLFQQEARSFATSSRFVRQLQASQSATRDHYAFHAFGFDYFNTTSENHRDYALGTLDELRRIYDDALLIAADDPDQAMLFFGHCPAQNMSLGGLLDQYLAEQRSLILNAAVRIGENPALSISAFGYTAEESTPLGTDLSECVFLAHQEHLRGSSIEINDSKITSVLFWLLYPSALLFFYTAFAIGLKNEVAAESARCQTMFRQLPVEKAHGTKSVRDYMLRYGLMQGHWSTQEDSELASVSRRNSFTV
eukprot:TRINITY_DN3123_c0_g1_i14.p1 TRINITY_DN3123_c0_g1~~TRINITY_DN3123_c0_g1_i14.p1  ORF type:complete len:705 (-),score=115.42 TRINITY_DN3123_c0_g1_i14:13-1812(-)